MPKINAAGIRQISVSRVFGVKARFDRVTLQRDILLRKRQWRAACHSELQRHKVQPSDQFGDRMFDLKPRVHFKEVKRPAGLQQKLHCSGTAIVHRPRSIHRRLPHTRAQFGRHDRARRFFHHLLMPPLDGTIPFAQMDDVAMSIRENLDFNMTRLDNRFLDDQLTRDKGIFRFRARQRDSIRDPGGVRDQPHPAPPATGGGLDHNGEPDVAGLLCQCGIGLVFALIARHTRHARCDHQSLGLRLVAHGFNCGG